MAFATVEIKGEDELMRCLRILPQKVSKQLQMKALREGSKPLIKAIREEAPKRTGTLIKSVGSTVDRQNKGAGLWVGIRTGKKQKYDGWYGWFVHAGTKGVGKRKRTKEGITYKYGSGHGITADPFVERAWNEEHENVFGNIKKVLQEVVVKHLQANAPRFLR